MISLRKSHNESLNYYKSNKVNGVAVTEEAAPTSKHVYDAYLITNTNNASKDEAHYTRNSVTQNNSARIK